MNVVTFRVPMRPAPKERPRAGKGNRIYTPKRTHDNEAFVLTAWRHARLPRVPASAPFTVSSEFFYQRPASHLRKDGALSAEGMRRPVPRGADIDNLQKLVLDALNGWAWEDDALCTRSIAEKLWGPHDEIIVRIFWREP